MTISSRTPEGTPHRRRRLLKLVTITIVALGICLPIAIVAKGIRDEWRKAVRPKKGMSVIALAFSPDGRLAISGHVDATARLWDIETGQEVRRFEGHAEEVLAVAFSPDCTRIATGSLDETASTWDAETGVERSRFNRHRTVVRSTVFSADGRHVFTGDLRGTIWQWTEKDAIAVREFAGHTNSVFSLAVSKDGVHLLSGGWDKTARLWAIQSGNEVHRLVITEKDLLVGVKTVAFSQASRRALMGTDYPDTSIRVLDVASWRETHRVQMPDVPHEPRDVSYCAFLPGEQRVLSFSRIGRTIMIWDLKSSTGTPLIDLERSPWCAALSPNGRELLLGGEWGMELWDIESRERLRQFDWVPAIGNIPAPDPSPTKTVRATRKRLPFVEQQ